jgi:hypothetical protein
MGRPEFEPAAPAFERTQVDAKEAEPLDRVPRTLAGAAFPA